MAVVKATIKTAVKALLDDLKTREDNQPQAIDDLADGLADIIRDAILSATVNPGIVVQVTPATGTGATTGTGTLS